MDAWQKDFWQLIEAVADGAEQMLDEMTEAVEEIVIEIDQAMTDAIEPIIEAYFGLEVAVGEVAQPIIQTVNPILEEHPACVGCRHFHGQAYGGQLLVCAMHPYGVVDDADCPDKESIWEHTAYNPSAGNWDD